MSNAPNFFSAARAAMATIVFASLLPLAAYAGIEGVPQEGALNFTVLRDGSEIGEHKITFDQSGDDLKVDINTDIKVTLPLIGIAVYRFEHEGHEVWRNGHLAALNSKTYDDGTDHKVDAAATEDALAVKSDIVDQTSAATIIPASLWNPALMQQSVLLNTLDGHEMAVQVETVGMESVNVKGAETKANHIRVSGGLERDLWYTPEGSLVMVRFAAKDGSEIKYVLR
ncbi:hypothetical protein EOI86_22480 [Hwanghaeella grinnelliae]|uniref:DUF3108 domain-containing protein n=1 Tax=Hwanghaeella grinnelliae TaxID=2500179 RepID=A0A437QH75_9PROT|nr:DUF6134 family protein [Hwanghaeella grinnelliae]RVU33901.1 hypothetical protein EOI86_22480 [Hwanghaeella grinnelliae]